MISRPESADETAASGMGKPIPYKVLTKHLHQISAILRCTKRCGFLQCFDTGQPHSPYRYSLNAPLKRRPLSQLRCQLPLRRGAKEVRHKICSAQKECEIIRFVPFFRYRASAINVYVHSQSATEKTTPQSASLTAPLAQGSQGGAAQNMHHAYGMRNAAVCSVIPIPCKRNKRMGTALMRH